jgi:hypothetical protein
MKKVDFLRLKSKVKADTEYSSNPNDIVDHPAHKEIVEAGTSVIKYILQDLQEDPWHWFMALYLITGEVVIKEEHRGMVLAMTEDWLAWGRENEYIPNKP